ncbi:MAG: SoxR reducing system RseC family protein [Sulfuritalea sp.]|nr:SoxR reducing system RseC family protein [Sulfuritalea sp.]
MSQCDAVVVKASDSQVWVEVPRRASACSNCQTPEACQDSLLGFSAGPRRYRLENSIGARVGDRVQLVVAEGTLWQASLASYVIPVLFVIIGAAVGQSLAGDLAAALGALIGLGCGLALLRIKELRARYVSNPYTLQIQSPQRRFKEQS